VILDRRGATREATLCVARRALERRAEPGAVASRVDDHARAHERPAELGDAHHEEHEHDDDESGLGERLTSRSRGSLARVRVAVLRHHSAVTISHHSSDLTIRFAWRCAVSEARSCASVLGSGGLRRTVCAATTQPGLVGLTEIGEPWYEMYDPRGLH